MNMDISLPFLVYIWGVAGGLIVYALIRDPTSYLPYCGVAVGAFATLIFMS